MKFSIITITYNRAHLISQTIESVLKQTYQNFELLIIDDGSTDNTENLVTQYIETCGTKIKYIKNKNIGIPSKLRNIGLKNASGDIISVLDSDDLWVNEKLEEMYRIFSQNDDVKFVFHNLQHFTEISELKDPFYKFNKSFYKNMLNELLRCEVLAFPIFSMRTSLVKGIGFFDEAIMEGQHDYYLRVSTKYKLFYLDKPLTFMRRHEGNLTKNRDVLHCLDAITSYEKLKETKQINRKQYVVASNIMNYRIAKFYFQNKESQKVLPYLKKINYGFPSMIKLYLKSIILRSKSIIR